MLYLIAEKAECKQFKEESKFQVRSQQQHKTTFFSHVRGLFKDWSVPQSEG